MSFPKPPEKIVPFESGPVAPHDIGRQFDEHRRATANVIDFLRRVVRDDGVVRNGTVGAEQLAPDLPETLAKRAVSAVEDLLANVRASASQAQASAAETRTLRASVAELQARIAASADAMSRASEEVRLRLAQLENLNLALRVDPATPTLATGVLGPNAGGFYGVDALGASATAQDYAQVSIEWAEHMPDTIPPTVMAINAITGEHWSSRWWANKSANAFGMMAWWYQGAWPDPGPPNTPLTPTNEPLPPGAMYWNTDRNEMMVWNGTYWVPIGMPSPATTAALYFPTTAGKTAYPTTAADLFGHSFTLLADGSNGVVVHANGVRLTPDDGSGTLGDYTIDSAASIIDLVRAMPTGYVLAVDVLVPPSQLAPAATKIDKMKPLIFDGTTTVYTLQTTAGATPTVNNATELFISLDGVPQEPTNAYSCSGDTLTFVTAPTADAYAYILWYHPPG